MENASNNKPYPTKATVTNLKPKVHQTIAAKRKAIKNKSKLSIINFFN